MERVAALPWNQWQASRGIGGSFGVEYALQETLTPAEWEWLQRPKDAPGCV